MKENYSAKEKNKLSPVHPKREGNRSLVAKFSSWSRCCCDVQASTAILLGGSLGGVHLHRATGILLRAESGRDPGAGKRPGADHIRAGQLPELDLGDGSDENHELGGESRVDPPEEP